MVCTRNNDVFSGQRPAMEQQVNWTPCIAYLISASILSWTVVSISCGWTAVRCFQGVMLLVFIIIQLTCSFSCPCRDVVGGRAAATSVWWWRGAGGDGNYAHGMTKPDEHNLCVLASRDGQLEAAYWHLEMGKWRRRGDGNLDHPPPLPFNFSVLVILLLLQ